MTVSRRTLLSQSAAAALAVSLPLSACSDNSAKTSAPVSNPTRSPDVETSANALLDQATELMLRAYPESASSAGIDKGDYAGLKSKLTDRSPAGQATIEGNVRAMLKKLKDVDTAALPADTALNVDVVSSVFDMGLSLIHISEPTRPY